MAQFDFVAEKDGLTSKTHSVSALQFPWRYLEGPMIDRSALNEVLSEVQTITPSELGQRNKTLATPFAFRLRGIQKPAFYIDHHACHAYYAHYYSGGLASIIVTHDGGAPLYPFHSGGIYLSDPMHGVLPIVSHNLALGLLYDRVAIASGLENEPGKLMGLAAYASPSLGVYDLVGKVLRAGASHDWRQIELLSDDVWALSQGASGIKTSVIKDYQFMLHDWSTAIQAAANTQLLVQSIYTHLIEGVVTQIVQRKPEIKTLDLTGGFTFNCPSNSMLQKMLPQMLMNPLPASGDAGLSIGAAVMLCRLFGPNVDRKVHATGTTAAFPPTNRKNTEAIGDVSLEKIDLGHETMPEFIARRLISGDVLCIFSDKSEAGPRALGNRSIIALAKSQTIRDRINKSKGRELWRPLAPICRDVDFQDYFEGDRKNARYMLFTFRVISNGIPGVTHADGTARVQCVTEDDPWLYPALGLLKQCNEIPVIINTSFNCAGEPLVETENEAFSSFKKMRLDFLLTERGVYKAANRQISADWPTAYTQFVAGPERLD
jgi:carbamoyltransferase